MANRTNKLTMFLWGFAAGVTLSVAFVAILSWSAFRNGFSARAAPSSLEAKLAGAVLHASVPARYQRLKAGTPVTSQSLHNGMEHFSDHCASCHANNGSGDTMYGRGLNPRPRDLRSPETQSKSDGELYAIIQNGIRMSGMPAFGEPGVHDHGTWELVQFLRHLPALTPQEELEMQGMNPVTPSELKEQQSEEDFLSGPASQSTNKGKAQ